MSKFEGLILTILCLIFIGNALYNAHVQDDAYITYRYAENFLDGHGLVFNIGERVEGYTNFLWLLILAAASGIGLPIILASQVLGVFFGVGTVILSYFLARTLIQAENSFMALIAPLLLSVSGALAYWSIGGLETGMFVFLVSLAIFMELKRPSFTPLILIIMTLTRPEGLLVFVIIFIYRLIFAKSTLKSILMFSLLYMVPLMLYATFKILYFGNLLPNSFYAKTGFSMEYLISGLQYFLGFVYHYGFFGILFIIPLIFVRHLKNAGKLMLMTILVYTAYVVLIGGDVLKVHRFFLPILALLYAFIPYALEKIRSMAKQVPAMPKLAIILVAFLVVWSVYIPISYIKETRYREAALIDQMTAKAKLIQSADNSDFTVAATTIGALSYTLKKHKIIDMLGLTNPEIAKNPEEIKGMKSSWKERNFNSAYILHERPDYIIFSTGYKPSAPAERALFLNSQFRQNYSTICFALQKIGGLTAIWKKTGDFADSNRVMDNPEYADLFNRFFSRYSDGDYDKNAENIVRKILAMGNDDFSLPEQMLGTIFLANNNFDSAFAHYKKAMELDPANIECRLNMYMYYKTIGDITRSQLLYNEISSMAPWLLPVLNWNEK